MIVLYSVTAPFLTRLVKEFTQGTILQNEKGLARDLRIVLEKLGPTFGKSWWESV